AEVSHRAGLVEEGVNREARTDRQRRVAHELSAVVERRWKPPPAAAQDPDVLQDPRLVDEGPSGGDLSDDRARVVDEPPVRAVASDGSEVFENAALLQERAAFTRGRLGSADDLTAFVDALGTAARSADAAELDDRARVPE